MDRIEQIVALEAEGRVTAGGLRGGWRRIEDLERGRWRVDSDFGVFRTSEGDDGNIRWRQDPSGGVHPLNSEFMLDVAASERSSVRQRWEGEREVVMQMPTFVRTIRYGSYAPIESSNPLLVPHQIETTESGSSRREVVQIIRWRALRSVPEDRLAQPQVPADSELAGPCTVPFDGDGLILLPAKLNGMPFRFIFDTGGQSIVTPQAAQALGLRPVGAGAVTGAGAGELLQQHVRVESLEIGSARMNDQHFYVEPLPFGIIEQGAQEPLAGILGLEVFERFGVLIDYAAKQLTLRRFEPGYRGRGAAVALTFADDVPLVSGKIAGHAALMALDTGNARSTILQPVWARSNGLEAELMKGIQTASFGVGGESRNWASRIGKIEIGGLEIERPVVRYVLDDAGAFTSRTEAANIGAEILSAFTLDIDYSQGVIWFEPRSDFVPPAYDRSGMRVVKNQPDRFSVSVVAPGSPTAAADLRRGDEILQVDDTCAASLSGSQMHRKLTQPPGTVVELLVSRGGGPPRALRIELQELLP